MKSLPRDLARINLDGREATVVFELEAQGGEFEVKLEALGFEIATPGPYYGLSATPCRSVPRRDVYTRPLPARAPCKTPGTSRGVIAGGGARQVASRRVLSCTYGHLMVITAISFFRRRRSNPGPLLVRQMPARVD